MGPGIATLPCYVLPGATAPLLTNALQPSASAARSPPTDPKNTAPRTTCHNSAQKTRGRRRAAAHRVRRRSSEWSSGRKGVVELYRLTRGSAYYFLPWH